MSILFTQKTDKNSTLDLTLIHRKNSTNEIYVHDKSIVLCCCFKIFLWSEVEIRRDELLLNIEIEYDI